MITFFLLILFGTVIVGFALYHFVFKDQGRKARSGKSAESTEQHTSGRASGLD